MASDKKSNQETPDGFEGFWACYPRKVAKLYALKSFKAQLRKGHKADEIIRGASSFAGLLKQRGTDRSFIPHPSTWLNGERWTDDELRGLHAGSERRPPECPQRDFGRYQIAAPYLGGCQIDGEKIITPTAFLRDLILKKFSHKIPDLIVEVARG